MSLESRHEPDLGTILGLTLVAAMTVWEVDDFFLTHELRGAGTWGWISAAAVSFGLMTMLVWLEFLRVWRRTSPLKRSHRPFLGGVGVGVLVGVAACWGFGLFATHYHPVEESKLCYHALTTEPEKLEPQTREYLKARYYWNAAVWLSPSWQAGWLTDFGPVDDSLLVGLHPYKDASTSSEVYQAALRKHRVSPRSK